MNKAQIDLLAACYNRNLWAGYKDIKEYAAKFKKYDNMRMSEIDEVVEKYKKILRSQRLANK